MKETYKKYYNLDSDIEASYVKWDISNNGEVIVPELTTYGTMNTTKEELNAMIQQVIEDYV